MIYNVLRRFAVDRDPDWYYSGKECYGSAMSFLAMDNTDDPYNSRSHQSASWAERANASLSFQIEEYYSLSGHHTLYTEINSPF